jgi:peroxiredoxin Q/BCP
MLLEIGDFAPDFTLVSDEGKTISLKDFHGRKVVLYFYPKDGTSGCTQEAREFSKLYEKFRKEDTVIIGISMDDVESHRKFKVENNIPFILLSDPEGKVLKKYGVLEEPVNKEAPYRSVVRTTFLISEDGRIVKIYRRVNPKGHAEVCLLDLKSLTR